MVLTAGVVLSIIDLKEVHNVEYALFKIILLHEIGHFNFDKKYINLEERMDEGLAGWFSLQLCNEYEKKILHLLALHQSIKYNYLHMIPYINNLKDIIVMTLHGKINEAIINFYRGMVPTIAQEATGGGTIIIKDNIHQWMGFGATNLKFFIGEELDKLCNLSSCIVVASKINSIIGILPKSVKIFANEILDYSSYNRLPAQIKIIPLEQYNIQETIQKDDFDPNQLLIELEKFEVN